MIAIVLVMAVFACFYALLTYDCSCVLYVAVFVDCGLV